MVRPPRKRRTARSESENVARCFQGWALETDARGSTGFIFVVRRRRVANVDGQFLHVQPPTYTRFYICSIHGQFRPLAAKLIEAIGHPRAARTLLPFLDHKAQGANDGAEAIRSMRDWSRAIGDTGANVTNANQASRGCRM